jgi:hypothetical protein
MSAAFSLTVAILCGAASYDALTAGDWIWFVVFLVGSMHCGHNAVLKISRQERP